MQPIQTKKILSLAVYSAFGGTSPSRWVFPEAQCTDTAFWDNVPRILMFLVDVACKDTVHNLYIISNDKPIPWDSTYDGHKLTEHITCITSMFNHMVCCDSVDIYGLVRYLLVSMWFKEILF